MSWNFSYIKNSELEILDLRANKFFFLDVERNHDEPQNFLSFSHVRNLASCTQNEGNYLVPKHMEIFINYLSRLLGI